MLLALKEMIRRHSNDDMQFFQMCYMWKFGKFHDCVSDLCQYRLYAVIPVYVQEFVREKEHDEDCFGF